jgi:hypothetical protein
MILMRITVSGTVFSTSEFWLRFYILKFIFYDVPLVLPKEAKIREIFSVNGAN